jgi:hypothetical protein
MFMVIMLHGVIWKGCIGIRDFIMSRVTMLRFYSVLGSYCV